MLLVGLPALGRGKRPSALVPPGSWHLASTQTLPASDGPDFGGVTKLEWGYSHVPSNRPEPLGFGAQALQQARRARACAGLSPSRNPAMPVVPRQRRGYVSSEWRSSATVTRPPRACRYESSYMDASERGSGMWPCASCRG